MRLVLSSFAFLLFGCGGGSNHPDAAPPPTDSAPDSPATTTLTIQSYRSSGPTNPQLVAVQDGDGPWTVLAGTSGVYTTQLHHDRYGFLVACLSTTTGAAVSLVYGTIADATSLYVDDCEDTFAPATITGSVVGASPADSVRVLSSDFGTADVTAGTTAYSLDTSVGPEKILVEELANKRPVKLALADVNVVPSETVNFDLATGFAPSTQAVTATSAIGSISTSFRDATGLMVFDHAAAPFDSFRAIPAEHLGSGLNRLVVTPSGTSSDRSISVIRYFKNPAPQSIAFPSPVTLAQPPTALTTPYPSVSFQLPVRADATLSDLAFSVGTPGTADYRDWSIELTSAWIAKAFPGASSVAYTVPDLHALAGWQAAFQLPANQPIDWSIGYSSTHDVDWFYATPPHQAFNHDGSELQLSSINGQLH